jgi:hypothetical protein
MTSRVEGLAYAGNERRRHEPALLPIPQWMRDLPTAFRWIAAAITGVTIVLAVSGAVKAGLQMPAKFDQHMVQTDSVIYELRELRKLNRATQLCPMTYTTKADVQACVVRELSPQQGIIR